MLCFYCTNIFSQPRRLNQYYSIGSPDRMRNSSRNPVYYCEFCRLVDQSAGYNMSDPNQDAFIQWTKDGFLVGVDGRAIVPISRTVPSSPRGVGRRVRSKLKSTMLRGWYTQCKSSHPECQPVNIWDAVRADTSPGKLSVLRLADVTSQCIREFDPTNAANRGIVYAALSYAQQGMKHPKVKRLKLWKWKGLGYLKTKKLPQTYRDIFHTVKKLGLRYVWIDKLCLLNDDAADTQNGVNNMDKIYQGASITIIATDGRPQEDIKAVHSDPLVRYYSATMPWGEKWAVTETLFSRLAASVYMTRGWTYQELVLSHRLLVFIEGQAFFLCRRQVFSEDTWWDKFPAKIPPKNKKFWSGRIPKFIPPTSNDPISLYLQSLAEYRSRDIGEDQLLNGFRGVLSHLTGMMKTHSIYGLPRSMFDVALVWWHLPTINAGNTISRNHRGPSWSWAGWMGGTPIPFLPPGSVRQRNKFLTRHDPGIPFWYKSPGAKNMQLVWTKALRLKLGVANPGYGRPGFKTTPRPPSLPSYLRGKHWSLCFRAEMLPPGSVLAQFYPWGRGEIQTSSGQVVGIVYADEQLGSGLWNAFEFIVLYKSKKGDQTFNNGRLLTFPGPYGGFTPYPKIRAEGLSLKWVLMVAWDPRGFYERKGLGFIVNSQLGLFGRLRKEWVFLH
ncbi:hypothetical protein FE257_011404 [Aspergillus nanangensis]|uniref:Heterokaryon incompatibility domain-containing protein n=1 Tax=Aspergillus nanangensis TaxID=2582783 RepID=A0AAD4GRF5_ASPNN|nr:hypothetical protein FE257_011404 [Aspergillus nanangensis]